MSTFLTGVAIVLFGFVYAWWNRKAPANDPKEPSREREESRDVAADEKHEIGVKAIEARAEKREALSDVDRAQAILDSSRGRKGPLVLILCLIASPARANDCLEVPAGVLCSRASFHELVVEAEKRGDERDLCTLNLATANEKLDAAREHVAVLVAIPVAPNPWPERAVWGAIVVVLVTIAVAR